MLKFIMALIAVGCMSQFVQAADLGSQLQTPAHADAVRPPNYPGHGPGYNPGHGPGYNPGHGPGYGRGYYVQWRDAYTNQSITGWVFSRVPYCGHGDACDCGGRNYCGQYSEGQQAYYWDRGCWEQPRMIVCDVEDAD